MSYSPRRVLPGGLQPAETRAIADRIVSQHPRQVKTNHLSTHFDLTGDSPASYNATLSKTTTAGLTDFISSTSPSKDRGNRNDNTLFTNEYKDRNTVSQINYAVGGSSGSSSSSTRTDYQLIYDPKILSRTEIRKKMNTQHIDFRGPQSPNTVYRQELAYEKQPVEGSHLSEPRIPSSYGHTERSYRHLQSGFEIFDMEPRNKELLSRTQKKIIPTKDTTVQIIGGPAPGEYTRICHDRKQNNLGSNFSLG